MFAELHPGMALAALLSTALWGIAFRAAWQHLHWHRRSPAWSGTWPWIGIASTALGLGLWSATLALLAAIDVGVPMTVATGTLWGSALAVTLLHVGIFSLGLRLPTDTQAGQRMGVALAVVFSGGWALTMLVMIQQVSPAPTGRVPGLTTLGLAVLVLSTAGLAYRQVGNRWRGGALTGVLFWVVGLLTMEAVDWAAPSSVASARGLPWATTSLGVSAFTAMAALLATAAIARLRYRLEHQPLPDAVPDDSAIDALAEARARDMVEERKQRDALYDRVLRHSKVRFWALDLLAGEYRFRGDLLMDDAQADTDMVIRAADWRRDFLHPDEVDRLATDLTRQLGAQGGFDQFHRLRLKPGADEWRWVISRGTVVRRNAAGQPTYIVGTHLDVTEHRDLQLAMERNGRLFSDGSIVMVRWLFDAASARAMKLDFISPNVEKLWGYSVQDILALPDWKSLVEAEDIACVGQKVKAALEAGVPEITHEFRLKSRDGRVLWHSLFARIEAQDGHGFINGFIVDIDSFKRVEQQAGTHASQLQALIAELERAKDETVVLRESSEFLNSSESMDEAFGIIRRAAQAIFPDWSGALTSAQDPERFQLVGQWGDAPAFQGDFASGDCWSLRRGRAHHFIDDTTSLRCRHVRQVGDQPVLPYVCIPMLANGDAVGSLHLMAPYEVTREQMATLVQRASRLGETLTPALSNLKLRAGLREQATHDGLTGLYNRRFMDDRLPVEVKRCQREGQPLTLAMIDVDHFKRFNDQFGHDAGDAVLKALGQLLLQRVRIYDLACRYGGEEMTLIMPGCDLADAQEKMESLRAEVAAMAILHNGLLLPAVTISIGLADNLGAAPENLLRQADELLYEAKRAGRNRLVVAAAVPA